MTDECTFCGKCCRSLGPYIKIVRHKGQTEFLCNDILSKSNFNAYLERNMKQLFLSETIPGACVFLRKNEKEEEICTIYASRPVTCKNFICKKTK